MALLDGKKLARRVRGELKDRIAALEAAGLVARSGPRLAATARGRIVLNRVLAELLA